MHEEKDMTVPCQDGMINIRVGAVILKNGRFLMVRNSQMEHAYSVGGRVQFGETAREAVVREVMEETGVPLRIDRLGFVHENYFYGDSDHNRGKLIYEIAFFFYMAVPPDFQPAAASFNEGNGEQHLLWVSPEDPILVYPAFFKTELRQPRNTVRHFVSDERNRKRNA